MKKVLLTIIIVFVFLQLINVVTRFLIFDRTSYEPALGVKVPLAQIINPWLNFDGLNYLSLAKYGYIYADLLVFFPMFSILVRIFSLDMRLNLILIGLILTYICALISALLFYDLTLSESTKKYALKSVLLFLIFPSSFFLFSYYTESLFLAFAIAFFWSLNKKRFLLACLFVSLATATKIFGVALIVTAVYVGYKEYKSGIKIIWPIILTPLGIFSYLGYIFVKFGNPFLVFTGQNSSRFGRHIGLNSPVIVFYDTFYKIIKGPVSSYDNIFVYPVILLEFLTILFAIIMVVVTFRKMEMKYWLYCFSIVAIMLFSGGLSSDLRYSLILFPFFVYLARHLHEKYLLLWSLVSIVLLAFSCTLFLRNYWIA